MMLLKSCRRKVLLLNLKEKSKTNKFQCIYLKRNIENNKLHINVFTVRQWSIDRFSENDVILWILEISEIWKLLRTSAKKIGLARPWRAAGVRRARIGIFFQLLIYFTKIINLLQWSKSQNSRFKVAYVVRIHIFARCGRAGRVKRKFPMK